MPPLTDTQEKVLTLLPILPSLLSFVSSWTIIIVVYQHYRAKGTTTVYQRLLVGMSVSDVIYSFWYPWIGFLLPATTSTRVWAIGTDGTCSFLGFLYNFGFMGFLYNVTLSYYFLLSARFGWREKDIAWKVEPFLHALAIAFPLACGLTFVGLGVYGENPLGLGCWVDDYPPGCGSEEGQEPCITPLLGWISAGIPFMFAFVSLLVNNTLIYCHVRSTLKKAQRHSSHFLSTTARRRSSVQNDPQNRRLRSVAVQAGLYVLIFFLNYIWTFVLRNMGAQERYWTDENESELFWLMVLQAMILPMQGVFNLVVFSRPKYLKVRKLYPNHSRLWVIRKALFGDQVQDYGSSGRDPRQCGSKTPSPIDGTATTMTHNSTSNALSATFAVLRWHEQHPSKPLEATDNDDTEPPPLFSDEPEQTKGADP